MLSAQAIQVSHSFSLCVNISKLAASLFHTHLCTSLYLWACISPSLCAVYYKPLCPKTWSASSQSYHISALSFVIFLVFKAINVPFISEAEPDRGTGFRDTLLVFALKLRSVSVPSCSVTSEKKSSKLTLQVCRAPSSVICISGRKISRKNSKACSCLQL